VNSKAGAEDKTGDLYIVATPIGNLKDISHRAVEVLQQVDLILVEDTRNAIKLLQHYEIRRPMRALHEHNETHLAAEIIEQIKSGQRVALISDAGTPLMSDPGYRLVRCAQDAGIQAQTIPGACAAVAALSIAGLPTDRFAFEGFIPAKTAAREQRLQGLSTELRTLVFYEACHRIVAFLSSLRDVFGEDRRVVVARELTKKFETVYQGTAAQIVATISGDEMAQKGEFVVLVAGAEVQQDDAGLDRVLGILLADLPVSKASKIAAQLTGVKKNKVYQRALELQKGEDG
jgi:16S rRNA (cytidine1402-2'-O)-methyltransferase